MLDLLLPRRCVRCLAPGSGLCTNCATSLPAAPDLAAPPGIERCWSLLEHRDAGRDVVVALKYHRHHDAVALLGAAMAELVDRRVDLVTWAPTSPRRRRARGFDQAEVLARSVAGALSVPCRELLVRSTGATQTGHGRAERLSGPQFRCRAGRAPRVPVLLVDDVRTTGATLCAAAEALAGSGVPTVLGVTLSVRV